MTKKILRKIITTCLLAVISSTGLANPPDLPPGVYNLSLNQRPTRPYNAIPNYNTALTNQGTGPNFPVMMDSHHIIPYEVLERFYNAFIANGDHLRMRAFLSSFGESIPAYASAAKLDCSRNGPDYLRAANIAQALGFGWLRAGSSDLAIFPEGLNTFQEFYAWIPGNIFIGPHNRSDDEHGPFETNARYIVGNDAFNLLRRLHENMVAYAQGNTALVGSIATDLTRLSGRRSVYQLDPANWIFSGGSYRINTDGPSREPARQGDVTSISSECEVFAPNYEKFMGAYMEATLFFQ
ncbi:MAG TPA: hypothetical protein VGO76_14800 [Luteibacter sp.]|jgi:hypothetical protein|nr:hypothetical protein [Luteibacter sp.]